MKQLAIFLLTAASLFLAGAGCSSIAKPITETTVSEIPVATNIVTKTVIGPDGELSVINVPEVITALKTNETIVGWEPNPTLMNRIEAAKAANGLLNPSPTAPLVNMGLGALAAIATAVAGYKQRRLNGEIRGRDNVERVLRTVTRAAVEFESNPEGKTIRQKIRDNAIREGTSQVLPSELTM